MESGAVDTVSAWQHSHKINEDNHIMTYMRDRKREVDRGEVKAAFAEEEIRQCNRLKERKTNAWPFICECNFLS